MRTQALLIIFLLGGAVAAGAEITSANLIGEWSSGPPERANSFYIVFQSDHSFDYMGGDAHGAGKWKLHHGKKLELIYHYDYDPEPISSSSKRSWILIDSINNDRLRLRWYSTWTAGQLSPPEAWTKRH